MTDSAASPDSPAATRPAATLAGPTGAASEPLASGGPQLEEEFYPSDRSAWLRRVPWLLMLLAVRVSLDPRKLLLAAFALFALHVADEAIDQLPFDDETLEYSNPQTGQQMAVVRQSTDSHFQPLPTLEQWPIATPLPGSQVTVPNSPAAFAAPSTLQDSSGLLVSAIPRWLTLGFAPAALLRPWLDVNSQFARVFFGDRTWSRLADITLRGFAALVIWAWLGGAIARMSALRLTDDHPTSLLEGLRYSGRSLISSLGGVVTPLVGLLGLWGLIALVGLLALIPSAGPILFAIAIVPLAILGLAALILTVGTLLSWPLMVLTMAVEGTDGFDALSRAFGYLFGRPLYAAFLLLLLLLIGGAGAWLVAEGWGLGETLVRRFLATSLGDAQAAALFEGDTVSGGVLRVVAMVVLAWPAVWFWTATSAIYLLLRRSFEGTALDRIWIPPQAGESDALPLAGEPAAKAREAALAEKSATTTSEPPETDTTAETD